MILVTVLLEELIYNLRKGIFVNLILAVQFAVFFWQGTMLSTYFLEMSVDSGGLDSVPGDYAYYSLSVSIANEDDEAYIRTQSSNPDYTGNLAKAIDEIYADTDLHYMAFGYGGVTLPVYYDDIQDRFQGSEQLLAGEPFPSPLGDGGMLCEFANSWQFDRNSMEHFDFQVSEGRLLNEDDFIFDLDETEIPVLAGSEFAAALDVDDTLETHISGYRTRFRVVGILKEGTSVLTDQIFSTGEEGGLVRTLDNAFLVPYLEIRGTPRTEEEAFFIRCNYEGNMQDGMIVVDADTPRSAVSGIEKRLCEIFTKYGLYPVTTVGGTYGMDIFKTESRSTMQILLGAGILMGVLSISGICMSVIAKLNRNMHRYGIEIMNGQSLRPVMGAFLLEILLVIAAGMAFNVWKFSDMMQWNRMFLWVILGMALLAVLIVSAVFAGKLMKVDIEEIIRSEE